VVKFTDSISIPLIVFPLFKMIRINTMSLPKSISLSIIGFSILSFNPLLLNSDLQKNSLAILFLMGFIAFASSFQQNKKRISIFLSTLFLILTGLTHFGTFSFALFYLFLTMVFLYRKKAVIPVLLIFTLGIMLIGIFDSSRFFRIFTFGLELFDKPALIYGALMPPDFILVLFSYILAVIGIITLRKKGGLMSNNQKAVLFSSIVCLLVLSFPLFGSEYFKRLSLFLFIPQIILMLTLAQFLKLGTLKTMAITFLTITLLSVLAIFGHPKEVVIDHEAYLNLKNLNSIISSDDKTIVIARHGLEWWTAWALKTKVAQDKAVDYNLLMNYNNIYFLNQKKGFNSGHERTLFHEPTFPENAGLIYSSDYFNVYKWKK